jgi:hypothetical protein
MTVVGAVVREIQQSGMTVDKGDMRGPPRATRSFRNPRVGHDCTAFPGLRYRP